MGLAWVLFFFFLHKHVFNRYGFPEVIVSDRDPRFTSAFYTEWCRILRIRQNLSTAFHPETDGQSERFNRTLQQVLRCYCSVEQQSWTEVLPAVEFAINAAPNESTSVSPFMALLGFVPSSPFDLELKTHSFRSPLTQNFHAQQHAALQLAKKFYQKAQQRSKAYADKNRTEITFKVDDLVLLATKNLKRVGSSKLLMPYCGPFRVIKVVSPLAYQLDLPGQWKIHDVFHVSLLKPYKPRGSVSQYIPLPELVEGEEEHEIESIVEHRIKEFKRRGRGLTTIRSFFVKWKHFSDEHDQWVTEKDMTADFTIRNTLLDEYCKSHNIPLTIIKSARSAPVRRKTHKRVRTV